MYRVTAEYAKNNFDEVINRASTEASGIVIVRENQSFILISQEELDAWMETSELLEDPNLLSDISSARAEYKKGEALTMEQVFES
ncbi:MAG: type II toxin-antitoxin system prevent-host-death family antitoxin [Hormoscilla sp. SP5CHS1]|nr:type II toxin-antitoxin system prevent-host-death family antitoxin [Hormoscilla sp. SP12CHS1]MBC6456146.1 type II toxin-antitoxin system prevent-host-death family antitoxin [Hormoscilla sp. SP5CHS1]MBO1349520.1 type II toxin-antitoxin system prevent-host-death family antitoxin [Hormoscilla sp. GUM202]